MVENIQDFHHRSFPFLIMYYLVVFYLDKEPNIVFISIDVDVEPFFMKRHFPTRTESVANNANGWHISKRQLVPTSKDCWCKSPEIGIPQSVKS